jgi:hypothetical protein
MRVPLLEPRAERVCERLTALDMTTGSIWQADRAGKLRG